MTPEGVDITSKEIPSTPLARSPTVEKHTLPILLSYSPKGSQQWIRKVEEEFTPRVGMEFDTLEDGIQFYRIYAIACGFDIRKSTHRRFRDKSIRTKIILCHREGFGESKELKKLKLSRNLTLYHKQTIINHSKINIGASKTYRICKEVANGYENVGASLLDFKNFQREVKLFIGDADAEMFINNLEKLVQSKKGFQYAYHVDEGRNLCRVFWTDAHGKSAYLAFGDGVSFDPTYGTNKYCMVFTPFTGIDNHKKSVTFACALLSNEDEESFVWVFQKFMEAMGRKEPQLIITDQDPAIRNAVPAVFKTARHLFCMWHIMNKVVDKIDIITRKETDFLSRINGVVWNHDLEPTEFEDQWNEVITEFGLETNRWLSTMFDIKEYWISTYFRDMRMSNIMSTTQRLESENSFFKKFENHYGTLVEFWLRYESAMDQQRHTHKHLEMKSKNLVSKAITPLSLESHALTVRSASLEMTAIEDSERGKTFMVQYSPLTSDVDCTCKLFERRGLICRHIFCVFSNKMLKTIHEKYVLARWSKNALRGPIYDLNRNIIENYDTADEDLQRVLREFKDRVEPTNEKMSKRQEMEMLIGCSAPDEVRILPPRHSKNKGSGKRIETNDKEAPVSNKIKAGIEKPNVNTKKTCPDKLYSKNNEGA
ncbi:hypothetical protein RND81_08G082500 [Saponaria officinalis]|uniref:SWIM-type domain-containing protein n=1 Tax=Saponaria officinalis TaxID=3572 RepID=A0AAW1J3Z4_SAPOF